MDFLLDVVVPNNIVEMAIWYSVLVVCVVLFFVLRRKKKGKKRTAVLQEKIDAIESFKEQLINEKPMGKKDLFAQLFAIGGISEYCKKTFETSQFIVYDEASKLLDKAQELAKTIDVKKWKTDKTNNDKTEVIEYLDGAVVYLSQAL